MTFDAQKILDQLLQTEIGGMTGEEVLQKGKTFADENKVLTFGGLALLLGTGAGRSLTGGALKLGSVAAISMLAYKGYQNWQEGKDPLTGEMRAEDDFGDEDVVAEAEADARDPEFALALIRAMVNAAKADGHVTNAERAQIFDKISASDLGADARAFIEEELQRPLDVLPIIEAATTPKRAAELYLASLVAVDLKDAAVRGYLAMLAARLGIDDALARHLHAQATG